MDTRTVQTDIEPLISLRRATHDGFLRDGRHRATEATPSYRGRPVSGRVPDERWLIPRRRRGYFHRLVGQRNGAPSAPVRTAGAAYLDQQFGALDVRDERHRVVDGHPAGPVSCPEISFDFIVENFILFFGFYNTRHTRFNGAIDRSIVILLILASVLVRSFIGFFCSVTVSVERGDPSSAAVPYRQVDDEVEVFVGQKIGHVVELALGVGGEVSDVFVGPIDGLDHDAVVQVKIGRARTGVEFVAQFGQSPHTGQHFVFILRPKVRRVVAFRAIERTSKQNQWTVLCSCRPRGGCCAWGCRSRCSSAPSDRPRSGSLRNRPLHPSTPFLRPASRRLLKVESKKKQVKPKRSTKCNFISAVWTSN